MKAPLTPALPPLTDAELRVALGQGLAFWSRATGTPLSPAAADEMTLQQLVTIRRAVQRHAPPPELPPPVKHWSDRD